MLLSDLRFVSYLLSKTWTFSLPSLVSFVFFGHSESGLSIMFLWVSLETEIEDVNWSNSFNNFKTFHPFWFQNWSVCMASDVWVSITILSYGWEGWSIELCDVILRHSGVSMLHKLDMFWTHQPSHNTPAASMFRSLTDSLDYMKLLDLLAMEGMYNFDVLHVMSQWIGQLLFSRGSSTQ
jgi:hypothetical protein